MIFLFVLSVIELWSTWPNAPPGIPPRKLRCFHGTKGWKPVTSAGNYQESWRASIIELSDLSREKPIQRRNPFIYLFLAVLHLHCCVDFSLVVASGGYSLLAMYGLLIAVASLVRAKSLGHVGFHSCSSGGLECTLGLSCSVECKIFLD